jgi:hypothetical protein
MRILWGTVRALSLFLLAFGVFMLAVSCLEVLDILAAPFVRVSTEAGDFPDYRRESAIMGLLATQLSLGLGAGLHWASSAHRKQLVTPRMTCPHCGKPLSK